MRTILRFLSWLIFCPHTDVVLERHDLDGLAVMHWRCRECWRIRPVMHRSPGDHARVVALGVRPPRAVPDSRPHAPAQVLPMRKAKP